MSSSENSEENDQAEQISANHNAVKSTVIVKYSAVDSPTAFALLQCNTDLNLPPSNWLSSSAESYGLQYVLSNSTGFSSFRMADMFPDCIGEVDVISDAENIKKLLKLPYSEGPVSMLVHRIKATLLIDDFDIQKFLFRSADMNWNRPWKNFLLKSVFQTPESTNKCITDESKRRYVLQQENLLSKFLYRSIVHLDKKEPEKFKYEKKPGDNSTSKSSRPPLPEPNIEEEIPGTNTQHTFARNVVWTFENIQMLLGTDMPIFGGGTHPCVSLRLRDMNKSISVLTGIDYWLDNLMCNVPEVAMCYHIGGIVQRYELIKTEDLPYMEGSKFSPSVIRDVAQDILAFLKSNATKAGHTYWLLKGKDDDVVKLYDLTSLCSSNTVDDAQNPFTIPVALLLYRVARNMKHSPRVQLPTNPATIRMLLKNCINLLPTEKYPQIVTSAHYMFSDSLIPLNTDPIAPKLEDVYENIFVDGNDVRVHSSCQDNDDGTEGNIKTLCLSHREPHKNENSRESVLNDEEFEIISSLEKRCKTALEHVANGLSCLKYFDEVDSGTSAKKKVNKEEPQHMAYPSKPIPMAYESIRKDTDKDSCDTEKKRTSDKKKKKLAKTASEEETYQSIGALLCKSHIETMPTWQQPPDTNDNRAWKQHLRILLYEKACLVFATLAEHEYSIESYGNALKHIRMVLESRAHLNNKTCENILMSYLLGRAGDCCFQIGRRWNQVGNYKEDFIRMETFEANMKSVLNDEEVEHYKELGFVPCEITTLDNILNSSWMCYSKALELETRELEKDTLQRRLGNISNELGSFYMKQARDMAKLEGRISGSGKKDVREKNHLIVPINPFSLAQQNGYTQAQSKADIPKEKLEALFAVSLTYLENGISAFKTVNDEANLALLYSNTGRLMRLMAHYYSEEHCPLNKAAKSFYKKALSNYQSALTALSYRRLNPEIWDTVFYEMSTTLYTMATLLQEYPPQSPLIDQVELEREVADYLCKSLKYCDMETPGLKQPIYQFRAADIHHRLARLYHNTYRNLPQDSPRRSKILTLCNLHFERAVKLFQMLELPIHYVRARLEKVALYEFMHHESTNVSSKMKNLQIALDLILQCAPSLKMICDQNNSESTVPESLIDGRTKEDAHSIESSCEESNKENEKNVVGKDACEITKDEESDENKSEDENEDEELLELLETRLQFILRTLIKYCTISPKHSKETLKYKEMYSILLKSTSEEQISIEQRLYSIITQFACMIKNKE